MGKSLDRGAFGEVFYGVWRDNEVAVKVKSYSHPSDLMIYISMEYILNMLNIYM